MKAIACMTFGGPEVLRVVDVPEPHAGERELRIRVHAVAVNPTDTMLRSGAAASMLAHQQAPYIPGMDAAGVIDEVGPGNDGRLGVGDRVVAIVLPTGPHKGAYAQQIVVPAASVVQAPAGADFSAASTLLMNALTARMALNSLALRRGQAIAITGAAGALGGYAIQLARADGLRVIADAAAADRELVQRLGADVVVDRGGEVAKNIRAVAPAGVAGLIDTALLHERVVAAIADGGGLVTVRGWNQPVERGIRVLPVFVHKGALDTALLDRLRQQTEDGVITLRVAKVFSMSQAADAHRLLEAGGVRGRPVIDLTRD
jgi:NADPH:quinone reductase-like Zn-dependent oxidoreductase